MSKKRSVYIRSVLIGGGIGILFGIAATQKARFTQSPSASDGLLVRMLSIGLIGGVVAGMLWPALANLRNRGVSGHYAAWMIALSVAAIAVMLPSALAARSWSELLFGAFLGALAGMALAAYTRAVQKNGG